jgi:HD-GYP domain-containing protein (c-di-GMP phosphodiesterase class II)
MNDLVRTRGEVKPEKVSSLARMLVRGVLENQGSLMTVLNIHAKDEYTATHSLDVAILTLLQVEGLGLSESVLADIAMAGLLHDLGKLRIPDEVLTKAGALTDEEWQIMRRHPVWGAEMIHGLKGIGGPAVIAAFEHHLRYDSSGYPVRLRKRLPAGLSLMVAIADTYDAMRSQRPYQTVKPADQAATVLLKGAGTLFHAELARRFVDRVGVYGLGTLVGLSTGQIAVVTENRPGDPLHPVVRVMADAEGQLLDGGPVDTSVGAGEPGAVRVEKSVTPDERLEAVLKELKTL